MRIIHLLETLDKSGGGLPAAVVSLAKQQSRLGNDVEILTASETASKNDQHNPIHSQTLVTRESGSNLLLQADICHLHGVWNAKLWKAALQLRSKGSKIVVSPHGQLMKSLLKSDSITKKIKKRTYSLLLLNQYIKHAAMIHAVCDDERDQLKSTYANKLVCTIPNYIDDIIWNASAEILAEECWGKKLVITYLGRIDARKGVLDLVKAVTKTSFARSVTLQIVGPVEDQSTICDIKKFAESNSTDNTITISPPVYGEEKINVYRDSAVLCLPSYSEVIGLVNIEASLMRRMVMTTYNANITEIGEQGGILIHPGSAHIATEISHISKMKYEDYLHSCNSLYAWARKSFSPEVIDRKWTEALNDLLKRE